MEIDIAGLLDTIFNRLLRLDPQADYLLRQLGDSPLIVEVSDINMVICFRPQANRLSIDYAADEDGNNRLSATIGQFVAMMISKAPQSYIQKGMIDFDGDFRVLEAYQHFFQALRPDLLYSLSEKSRLPLTDLLYKPVAALESWLKTSSKELAIDFVDFIQHERRLFPCKEEVEDFFDEIQWLKQDGDRAILKLEALEQAFNREANDALV
ncbi:MAG: SCP2 sterol-binding domain-containing protein [Francisellaceae bacterium]